jgi:DNA polymerase III epsilon subunit-like protein
MTKVLLAYFAVIAKLCYRTGRKLLASFVMNQSLPTLTFVDIESGGLDPRRHPIIQLAAIAIDGETLSAIETIEIKVQFDEAKANKYAIRKNSYSRMTWKEAALPEVIAAATFAEFLKRHANVPMLGKNGREYKLAQLVAHNAEFDGEFLHTWFDRLNVFCPARRQVLCTLQRALWHFFERPSVVPPSNFKLETLCRHFGIPFYAADAHDALGDIKATVGLYKALVAATVSIPSREAA